MILEFSQSDVRVKGDVRVKRDVSEIVSNEESTEVTLPAVEKEGATFVVGEAHRHIENGGGAVGEAQGSGDAHESPLARNDNAMLMLRLEDVNRCYPLNRRKTFTIGRDETCDLVLADRQVSRRHAAIRWNGKFYQVEDLDSTNGTHLNGASASSPLSLSDGDELQIGFGFRIAFVDDGATAPLSMEPARSGLSIDMGNRTVRIDDQLLDPPLSPPQFHLLQILWNADSAIVSRDEIAESVWPEDSIDGISEQAIDALVRRLRERIAEIDPENTYIATIRGHGFRLNNRSDD